MSCGYLANGKYSCKSNERKIEPNEFIYREIIPLREMTDDYTLQEQKGVNYCTIMPGETCNPLQASPCCKGQCEPVYDETTRTYLWWMYACTEENIDVSKHNPRPFYACPRTM